jgi:hypothetical protein
LFGSTVFKEISKSDDGQIGRNLAQKFLKSKLSSFDYLNSGDGLKISEHSRVAGKERNKTPMGLGTEVVGIGN